MNGLEQNNNGAASADAMQKEIRALKRKLALAESNLARARSVTVAQNRADTVLNTSLKKELQFFKLVLENTTNILLLLDFDGRFAYASRTFLANAGIPSFGLINGRHFRDVLQPILSEENLRRFTEAVECAVMRKDTEAFEEQIDFNALGTPRTFSIFVTPMTDEEDGKSTGIMALFNDITEINDAMETAKRASLAKSDFLANMSHEIRTPLNAIIGMSAIAQGSSDIDKIYYCLDKINESSKHLLGIINDILDMSKIEASHFELSYSEFPFEKMMLRIIDVMRFKMEEKKIAFRLNCDPGIPYSILSDEQRLAQVIMNLLSNAIKFTPEFGSILLRVESRRAEDDSCVLSVTVKDSGIGISEEQKPRLFKAFSQADSSISRKFGGTGLGLAISKSIIQLLGGDIRFDSVVGAGTTFTFHIKARCARQDPVVKEHRGTVRILAADGDPDVLRSFSCYAEKLGVSCSTAKSAEHALDLLRDQPHDIIFADRETLGADGFSFVKRLADQPNRPMVVMMVSTADWSKIEQEGKRAGVREFVSKPIMLPIIEDLLEKYCEDPAEPEAEILDDFTGKTILLADDIQINREIVIALLEHTGIGIVSAENGREAVEAFAADPEGFALIFMDVQMPEMDGYEATRKIRALGSDAALRVPIVAMTANVFKEDIERSLASGMNDHVGKPVSMEEILRKIRQWVGD